MKRPILTATLLAAAASSACVTATTAVADLEPLSANARDVSGKATFVQDEGKVNMRLEASGLTPGRYLVQIHEGDCAAAGEVWNPTGKKPGKPARDRAGDAGELEVGEDGKARRTWSTWTWTIAGRSPGSDIVGKSLIIHGAEGSREKEACGVIELEQASG